MLRARLFLMAVVGLSPIAAASAGELRAGAAIVDVTPQAFPVLVNGGFIQASASKAFDRLHARAVVLDDGREPLAIVVVDSCMMPRELLDEAKAIASRVTGIRPDRMLISATHTHSAPAAMGALGCSADANYVAFLPEKLAEAVARAHQRLEPAEVGSAVVEDREHTFCRRWIRRPDRMVVDPFGQATGRAHMHPGYQNPDALGPSGPTDPALTVLSIRAKSGRPLAVVANYSMHYFGAPALSADYFGRFADRLTELVGARDQNPPFVAMMSQGTSGDQQWMPYGRPDPKARIEEYTEAVARNALAAYRTISHRSDVPVVMAETTLTLGRRVPDAQRLAWARPIVDRMGDRPPKDLPEVYAREALLLHASPERLLRLQAVRIGDLAITAIPNEVYALTGMKLKARSPAPLTMNIELANGSEGYIPPPEQHKFGGYTTWPARTAGLEVAAEPRIVESMLRLLEKVWGSPRLSPVEPNGAYAEAVLAAKPKAYWRFAEMDGTQARSTVGEAEAQLEDGIALYLDGPLSDAFSGPNHRNRALHLAGGRVLAKPDVTPSKWTCELWFRNALLGDARAVTGHLLGWSGGGERRACVGLGGTSGGLNRLFVVGQDGSAPVRGTTEIQPKSWHHLALRCDGRALTLFLDGRLEVQAEAADDGSDGSPQYVFGGRWDRDSTWEGRLDEVAVYDRLLDEAEIAGRRGLAGTLKEEGD